MQTIILLMSSPREKRNCHRRESHEISYLELVLKFSEIFRISLKPYKCKTLGLVMYVQLYYLAVDDIFNKKNFIFSVRNDPEPKRNSVHNIQINNKIHSNVYHVFYSLNSHQCVSAAIPVIQRVMLLLLD